MKKSQSFKPSFAKSLMGFCTIPKSQYDIIGEDKDNDDVRGSGDCHSIVSFPLASMTLTLVFQRKRSRTLFFAWVTKDSRWNACSVSDMVVVGCAEGKRATDCRVVGTVKRLGGLYIARWNDQRELRKHDLQTGGQMNSNSFSLPSSPLPFLPFLPCCVLGPIRSLMHQYLPFIHV